MRSNNLLTISYEFLGDLDKAILPESLDAAQRSVPLWQITHLKCFVATAGTAHYWKFQLQPNYNWVECFSTSSSPWDFHISLNHDWTLLRYDDYRLNPQHIMDVNPPSYSLLSSPQALHTLLKIDLATLSLTDQPLKIGLSAVTQLAANRTTYWALKYPKSGPDFHHADSFVLPI